MDRGVDASRRIDVPLSEIRPLPEIGEASGRAGIFERSTFTLIRSR